MRNIIEVLQERDLIELLSQEDLDTILATPTSVYCGFDPTADSLHLGNMIAIMGLAWFQRCGHTPVVICGGATALIGDPSGKSHERPLLDPETVKRNLAGIKKNFIPFLESDPSLPQPVYLDNYDWFEHFSLIPFLRDVGKHYRMGPMLAKDSVKTRLQSEEGMSFTEFCYQILQGYDFCHLHNNYGVTVQIGGSDQWGNITAGMELTRKLTRSSVHGITFPLLTRSDGKKFGKTESGTIWLSPDKLSSYHLYQYLYRIPDADVIRMMKMLTFMDMEEIRAWEMKMAREEYSPNSAQKKLAEEITRLLHGESGLQSALQATEAAAPGSQATLSSAALEQIADDIPNYSASEEQVANQKLLDVVVNLGIKNSKGEMRRLIKNGGVSINNNPIQDENMIITPDHLIDGRLILLALGKKNKIIIRVE